LVHHCLTRRTYKKDTCLRFSYVWAPKHTLINTKQSSCPPYKGELRSSHLWDGLCRAYGVLGFDAVLGGDEVLRGLVLARIIEPTSKIDAERVLTETGVAAASYRTVKRRLPVIAKPAVRQALSAACAAHAGLGPASLVLFDVSTLYFETDTGDGFREPGFSNYAEVPVMPRSWWLWWCSCCSAGLAGVARAA